LNPSIANVHFIYLLNLSLAGVQSTRYWVTPLLMCRVFGYFIIL